jgi:hypothetical protein
MKYPGIELVANTSRADGILEVYVSQHDVGCSVNTQRSIDMRALAATRLRTTLTLLGLLIATAAVIFQVGS